MDEILIYQNVDWPPFFKAEFTNAINKYNNSLTSGPDHILWSHVKLLIKGDKYITNLVNIVNS